MIKKIKVGGFEWDVIENQDIANEGNAFGSTHYRTQTIFLEPTATQQKKEQCLLHEIMHAIWWQTGLATRYQGDNNVREEEIVSALSFGLHQVLRENYNLNILKNDKKN